MKTHFIRPWLLCCLLLLSGCTGPETSAQAPSTPMSAPASSTASITDDALHSAAASAEAASALEPEQAEYRTRYQAYLREICEDYIQGGVFDGEIRRVSATLDALVAADDSSFCGYEAYQLGVPALRLFGQLRAESVLGQLAGTIPSEQALQADSSALVDASALDMDALGSMDLGPGGPSHP